MRIAYIYDAAYPWVKGGVERRIYEISIRLARRGHEIHWFCLNWWGAGNDFELEPGIQLHGVGKWAKLYSNQRRSIAEALYFASQLVKPILAQKLDIIDCNQFPYLPCFPAKLCSALSGTPLVITWHEFWDDYWFEYLGWWGLVGWMVERLAIHLPDAIVAVSETTRSRLRKLTGKDIRLIPSGIDIAQIARIRPSELSSDLIYVGRLLKHKNLDLLLESLRILKRAQLELRCIIVGDGPERPRLENAARGLDVIFTGFLQSFTDVISLMKSSRVFVLPSTREGFGLAALEANACGLPVVTLFHPMNAACEFISHGWNGFVCRSGSAEELAETILAALELGGNLSKNCIRTAMNYTWDSTAQLTESLYMELVR